MLLYQQRSPRPPINSLQWKIVTVSTIRHWPDVIDDAGMCVDLNNATPRNKKTSYHRRADSDLSGWSLDDQNRSRPDNVVVQHLNQNDGFTTTLNKGTLEIKCVAAGAYRFRISHPHYLDANFSVIAS